MNGAQAKRAAQTLEDIFTPEGDAVVIARLGKGARNGCALVTGEHHFEKWFPITELTAREDL